MNVILDILIGDVITLRSSNETKFPTSGLTFTSITEAEGWIDWISEARQHNDLPPIYKTHEGRYVIFCYD